MRFFFFLSQQHFLRKTSLHLLVIIFKLTWVISVIWTFDWIWTSNVFRYQATFGVCQVRRKFDFNFKKMLHFVGLEVIQFDVKLIVCIYGKTYQLNFCFRKFSVMCKAFLVLFKCHYHFNLMKSVCLEHANAHRIQLMPISET